MHLVTQIFENQFQTRPKILVRAPGRINLIGEHTDYNDGFVLPAAIDKAIWFAVGKRTDRQCRLWAADLDDSHTFSLDQLEKSPKGWANFLIGVTSELTAQGVQFDLGFNVVFGGDVPLGAGLSSSAAVEAGIGFALNELYGLGLSRLELALIAQSAEHHFAGVNCGIMDMYASLFGKENAVIKLDCRALTNDYFPFHAPDYQLILCNTGVKHSLGDSEYNTRRRECEAGVEVIRKYATGVKNLRDVSPELLEQYRSEIPPVVYQRCKYVVEEIGRVGEACAALGNDNLERFGQLMYATHDGLQHDYEVSCTELDFLVDATRADDSVLGARMMGGGFGGCTLNVVKQIDSESFTNRMRTEYKRAFDIELECYEVRLTNGVEKIALI